MCPSPISNLLLFYKLEKGFSVLPCSCSSLCIQINGWHSNTNKPCKKRLFHVGVFLKSHVLNDWWQLVMVTNHNPPLQTTESILGVLEWNNYNYCNYYNIIKALKTHYESDRLPLSKPFNICF